MLHFPALLLPAAAAPCLPPSRGCCLPAPLAGAQVHYADNERQEEVLALERVRLLVHAGEELTLAPASSLWPFLANLRKLQTSGQFARDLERRRALQARLAELTAYARERFPDEKEEDARRRSLAPTPGPSGSLHTTSAGAAAAGSATTVGRALALASQLPAGVKVCGARPPGPHTGASWCLRVRWAAAVGGRCG